MIGRKLKKYRLDLELTGETLAGLAGIKRSWLSQIENEKKYPPIDTFMSLVNALAKVSPITSENVSEILTENLYQEFKTYIVLEMSDLQKEIIYTSPKFDTENGKFRIVVPKEVETGRVGYDVYINLMGELGDNWNVAYIPPVFIPESDITKKDKIVDDYLKELFWSNYMSEDDITPLNLLQLSNEVFKNIIIYDLEEVSQASYYWWYNHILQDFDCMGFENEDEKKILNYVASIRNGDGTFTPNDEGENFNLSKELLNGKTVTFDLNEATNKNVRLLVEGQLLSTKEMAMLKVSLDAIKYNRQKK